MKRSAPAAFFVLAVVALVCAVVASVATLLWSGSFPPIPDESTNAPWGEARGWSLVTLVLAVPVLTTSLVGVRRRASSTAIVCALGTLAYLVYTYVELAVSPPFTALYLLYVATFACAASALVIGLTVVDVDAVHARFAPAAPRRSIAAYCALVAIGLTAAWSKDVIARSLAGDFGWPTGSAAIAHVVHALDLGLQVPLLVATAALLFAKQRAGFLLAGIALVNAFVMGSALTAMVAADLLTQNASPVGAWPFAILPIAALILVVRSLATKTASSSSRSRLPIVSRFS